MKKTAYIFFLFFWLNGISQTKTIYFKNGQWFNGSGFTTGSFYSVNGLLTKTEPAVIDTIIDLQQNYIIPPFGDAHNHSPEVEEDLPVYIERYLADGIFYIKNPNNIPFTTKRIADKINIPTSVDVIYANGGLTASGGHPVLLYNFMLTTRYKKMIPGWTNKSMEGEAYYVINNKEDLEKKWPFILSDKPAFLKAYLLYSEEFSQRKNDTLFNGKKGLDPAILTMIVKKAHEKKLSVSCHVETPADLVNALKSSVNEINHLPGYQVRWKDGYNADYYLLTPSIVRSMKKKKIHADPTYSLGETEIVEKDSTQYFARRTVQIKNLQLLKKYKVPVTVGCDSYNLTSRTEIVYLHQLGIYSNLELLKMWSETTPLAIFPQRKIGFLKEGYEASFLLLKKNPLENFNDLLNISLRVKQGVLLW